MFQKGLGTIKINKFPNIRSFINIIILTYLFYILQKLKFFFSQIKIFPLDEHSSV